MVINKTWTDEQLIEAVKTSTSRLEVMDKLGLKRPGNKDVFKRNIERLQLDTSHFHRSPKSYRRKEYTNEELFCYNSEASFATIRKRVIKENIIIYKCNICNINIWNNKPITLRLDHIDGDNKNHCLNNLRWLCPNCDSLQETYSGRNAIHKRRDKINTCEICGIKIYRLSKRCRSCSKK